MEKLKNYIHRICVVMEFAAAALVLFGIVLSVLSLLKGYNIFGDLLNDVSVFQEYLEKVFLIVIGIEFFRMLCRPTSDNVMEVLIFLVARHMIVGNTTPYEDFVSVVSIALLCVVRRHLHVAEAGDLPSEKEI